MDKFVNFFKGLVGGLAELMKKYGKETIINCVLLALLVLCMGLLIEQRLKDIIPQQLQEYNDNTIEEHQNNFVKSQEFYTNLKSYMRQQRHNIGCDYMLLLEYHNGTENVVTNIQFGKFDITLDVQSPDMKYNVRNYTNENIYHYDILLSDIHFENKVNVLTCSEIESYDPRFAFLLKEYDENFKYVVFSGIETKGILTGLVIYLFQSNITEKEMTGIINCSSNIEKMMIKEMIKK